MPEKKPSKKKTAARKAASRKTPSKTARKASSSSKKVAAAKKSAAKKSASSQARKSTTKPKASDFVRRPSHTPAIFKTANRRSPHILFTMEDVREVLRKRSKEEQEEAARRGPEEAAPKKNAALEEASDKPVVKSKHQAASLDDILGLSGGGLAGPTSRNNVPRKFQKYYNLLLELRNQVREELNLHSNDTLKRSQKEDSGDISTSVDAGTDNFDRDFALSLLSTEQEALNEIEEAIDRIHKGTYGICEVTGEPIKAERLEAVPFTRFSVEGQKQHELNVRKRVSRAGAFLNESSGEKISFGDDDGDN
ncbi:MAG TPA: TraR/DksA C4-type zinc finger protein [Oceanipulchritudo sp.]|nr:TraR/DksA C4-type zinc finger protein [Oceanipulchritudo sp.]